MRCMVDNQWQVANTDDFNGDARADLLWRHGDGTLAIWEMDGRHGSEYPRSWGQPVRGLIGSAAGVGLRSPRQYRAP